MFVDVVDLSLMRTFLLLYECASVTRAAEKLHVTQPSVSHALGRLRRQFADPLFVRTATGLEPTDLARRLYPDIRVGLEVIDSAVNEASTFDPATSSRTFRLLATDLGELALLPSVLAALEERGPAIHLDIVPLDFESAAAQLRQGRADVVICTPRLPDRDLLRDILFREHYVGLCAIAHPRLTATPSLENILGERHLVVDSTAGHIQAGPALHGFGHDFEVGVRVAHFAAMPRLIERTALVAIIPSTVADWFVRAANVRTFELPFETPQIEVALYRYRRNPPSPGVEWLAELIRDVLQHSAGEHPVQPQRQVPHS
jgi:DNA-binding transcriptional LysR family regulator